jgi:multicomponent Na+:H+ antiporter subunit F
MILTDVWAFAIIVLVLLILVTMARLFLGPTVSNRIVALDAINSLTIVIMILFGVFYEVVMLVDVAIVYALLSFVGTLYFAKYVGGEL